MLIPPRLLLGRNLKIFVKLKTFQTIPKRPITLIILSYFHSKSITNTMKTLCKVFNYPIRDV